MQCLNELSGRKIFVTFTGLAARRDGADFSLQVRGSLERVATLLLKRLAFFKQLLLGALNFFFVLFAQFAERIFVARRALRRQLRRPADPLVFHIRASEKLRIAAEQN